MGIETFKPDEENLDALNSFNENDESIKKTNGAYEENEEEEEEEEEGRKEDDIPDYEKERDEGI